MHFFKCFPRPVTSLAGHVNGSSAKRRRNHSNAHPTNTKILPIVQGCHNMNNTLIIANIVLFSWNYGGKIAKSHSPCGQALATPRFTWAAGNRTESWESAARLDWGSGNFPPSTTWCVLFCRPGHDIKLPTRGSFSLSTTLVSSLPPDDGSPD